MSPPPVATVSNAPAGHSAILVPPPPSYGEHLSHLLRARSPCPSPALLSSHTLTPIPSRSNSDSSTTGSTAPTSPSLAFATPSPLSSSEDPSPVSSAPNSAIFSSPSSSSLPRSGPGSGASTPTSPFIHRSPSHNHQIVVTSASSSPYHASHSRSHFHSHSPHHHASSGMNRGGTPQRLARLTSVASMLSVTSGVSMASAHRTLDPILLQHYLGLSRTLADLAPCPELLARNQAHVAQLEREVASQKALLPKLKRQSHKEHKDVERLRKLTISSLAAMLRGKYSSSLAREEQEFWASYAALQAAEDRVSALTTALQVAHATQTSLQTKCAELEAADREMAELESLLFPDLIAPPVPTQQQHDRGRTLTRGARSRVPSGAATPRPPSSAAIVDSGAPSMIGTPRCRSLSPSVHSIVSSDQPAANASNAAAPPSRPRSTSPPHHHHQSAASLLLGPPTTPAAVRAQVAVAFAQRDSTLEFIRVQQRRLDSDRGSLTTSHDHLNAALRHVNHAIAVMDQIRPDPCMECARLARMVEEAGGAQAGTDGPRARNSGPSPFAAGTQLQMRRGRSVGPVNTAATATSGVSDSDGGYTSGRGAGYDTDGPVRAPRRRSVFRWGTSSSTSASQPQPSTPGRRQRTFSTSSTTSTSSSSSDSSFERTPHRSTSTPGPRDDSQSRSRSRGRFSLAMLRPRPSGMDLSTRGNVSDADSVRDQLERRGRLIRVVEDPVPPGPASATLPTRPSAADDDHDVDDDRPMPVAPLPLTHTLSAPVSLVTTRNDHDDGNTSRSRSRGARSGRLRLRWGSGRRTDVDEDEPESPTFPPRRQQPQQAQPVQQQPRISVADLVGRCSLHPKVIPGAPTRRYSFSIGGAVAKVAAGAVGTKGMGGADIGLPQHVVTKVYDDTQIARLHVHEAVQAVPELADVVPMPSLQVSITATSVANIRTRLKTATSRLTRLVQETVRRQAELDNDAAFLRNDAVRAKRQAADTLVSLLRSAAMGGDASASASAASLSTTLSLSSATAGAASTGGSAAAGSGSGRTPSSTLQRLARSTLAAAGMGLTQTLDRLPAYDEAVAGGASGAAAHERSGIEV